MSWKCTVVFSKNTTVLRKNDRGPVWNPGVRRASSPSTCVTHFKARADTGSLDDGDDLPKPKKVTISGLTMAGIYQFQIRALGMLGYTDWMDTKTFVVA